MANYLCPMCVRRYPASQFRIHDRYGEPYEAPRMPLWKQLRQTDRDEAERLANLDALARGLHPRCPQGHPMPRSFLERPTLVIGLIGAAAVSKSTYLGVLFHELTHSQPFAGLGLNFFIDSYCEHDYQRIYASLLADNRAPLITQVPETVRRPLVLHVRDEDRGDYNLFLFDAAGEAFRNEQLVAQHNPYLTVMDAAMVFFTPVALDPALMARAGFQLPPGTEEAESTDYGPGATLTALQNVIAVRSKRAVPVPAAFVLAKYDELLALEGSLADLRELRAHSGVPAMSNVLPTPETLALRCRIAYEMTARFGPSIVQNARSLSLNHQFFALSAMGGRPNVNGYFAGVHPFGIYDPLLWILGELGKLD